MLGHEKIGEKFVAPVARPLALHLNSSNTTFERLSFIFPLGEKALEVLDL